MKRPLMPASLSLLLSCTAALNIESSPHGRGRAVETLQVYHGLFDKLTLFTRRNKKLAGSILFMNTINLQEPISLLVLFSVRCLLDSNTLLGTI